MTILKIFLRSRSLDFCLVKDFDHYEANEKSVTIQNLYLGNHFFAKSHAIANQKKEKNPFSKIFFLKTHKTGSSTVMSRIFILIFFLIKKQQNTNSQSSFLYNQSKCYLPELAFSGVCDFREIRFFIFSSKSQN